MSLSLAEFNNGIRFWRSRQNWPLDLHNSDYVAWASNNPNGRFTDDWWTTVLPVLNAWRATRPVSGGELTVRFERLRQDLQNAWSVSCAPFVGLDITEVEWDQVAAFPN